MPHPPELERHYDNISSIPFRPATPFSFSVSMKALNFQGAFFPFESDKLYISLHGAVDRSRVIPPVYARWDWSRHFKANILCISDPTLLMNSSLRIGWYVGTHQIDVTAALCALTAQIAALLGFPMSKVTAFGSSAGGFAALMLAARLAEVRAIAINPQIEITKYKPIQVAEFEELFGATLGSYSYRTGLTHFLRVCDLQVGAPKFVIIQNTLDWHYEQHNLPLRSEMQFAAGESISPGGRLMMITYEADGGHEGIPVSTVKSTIAQAEKFFGGVVI